MRHCIRIVIMTTLVSVLAVNARAQPAEVVETAATHVGLHVLLQPVDMTPAPSPGITALSAEPHSAHRPPSFSRRSLGAVGITYPMQAGPAEQRDDYERWARRVAVVQGAYYVATGLWPVIHMPSFEAVTGPKQEHWLVKTVGGILTVVGGGLLLSTLDGGAPSRDLAAVALGSAAALAAVDVIYVANGTIPPIYLLDAAAEAVLMVGWTFALTR